MRRGDAGLRGALGRGVSDQILDGLLASIESNEAVALLRVVKASGELTGLLGQKALVWLDRPPYLTADFGGFTETIISEARDCLSTRQPKMLTYNEGQLAIFVEVQRRPPTLLIVGAGHVALPLAQLGKLADFSVVVLDDRPQYANRHRFPMADTVLAQPFRETLRAWSIDNDTYIVLVTRGHSHDVDCLLEVLDSPARYIGMIGSKRRVKAVFDLLETEQNIDPTKLDKVYAPIGLDIAAESPGEIAIGIMADIINIFRSGRAQSLSDALRADRRLPLHPQRVDRR